ncbi:ABC transporter ATP-binding protein [Jonesia denitrificans]|uniref:ABC transporter related n=1 Tax=Jonesia denitrificans (strain ATCC 14870 / DSM 20603 / BCRC 15368 / CIP 55.134 / JCM 11481 / NBRC 15587 / NCTC 10816 / Prevot 55134) TaxID=471856 RepID=C7R5C8_JONDD|nr:ABC transporter ATP-binding protein [Jonesia denitrificans]ACV07806.1 ABC transporter related [Jonesia denitrificans DSM 20603]SQH19779.1 Putative HMP/thiamine import ATP-binding protein YkoD [Jonesia denitrificans]
MPRPLITVTDLSFRYPGASTDTLRNVNLTINEGDFVAVIGGNGSAKTTLCKTFNGLIPHYWNGEFAGAVHVNGVDTWTSSVAELSAHVGYVYQDFSNQLVRPTVRDEVSFGPVNYGHDDHEERTTDALNALGIAELAHSFVWQLSGGQAHLTALASVLAQRPQVLIVDEPVAELDPERAAIIYERLATLNRELGLTIITIEHHMEFVARYATSVVLMAQGAPLWHLPIDEAITKTDDLAAQGIPAPQPIATVQALGLTGTPRTADAAIDMIRDAHLTVDPQWPGIAHLTDSATTAGSGDTVARAINVTHGYTSVSGTINPVLRDVSVDIHQGDRIALVGGNGAGKSTLMRLLAGIIVPREGTVRLGDTNTRSKSAPHHASYAAYLYQHPELMLLTGSVADDVALFPTQRKHPDTEKLVNRILDRVRLRDVAHRDGRTLSGGQQRRATLAIGLAMRPTVLLLDEPTSSLDVGSRHDVTHMLTELADSIHATVVATHDMQLVAEWANRVLVLNNGTIIADCHPRDLFANPDILTRARITPPDIVTMGAALGVHPIPLSVSELYAAFYGTLPTATHPTTPATTPPQGH